MPRPKGSALNQTDILQAAIAIIQLEGASALGVNRVARQLGIRPPSLYNHIQGNEALFRLVALEGWRRFLDYGQRRLEGVVGSREMLRAMAYSYRECARDNPELLAIAASHAMSLDDQEFVAVFHQMFEIYTQALQPWGLSDDEIVHAARMLNAAFFGFAQADQARIFVMSQSLEDSYAWMVEGLIQAVEQCHHWYPAACKVNSRA
jgi:AcrR family transcriptional regulator